MAAALPAAWQGDMCKYSLELAGTFAYDLGVELLGLSPVCAESSAQGAVWYHAGTSFRWAPGLTSLLPSQLCPHLLSSSAGHKACFMAWVCCASHLHRQTCSGPSSQVKSLSSVPLRQLPGFSGFPCDSWCALRSWGSQRSATCAEPLQPIYQHHPTRHSLAMLSGKFSAGAVSLKHQMAP